MEKRIIPLALLVLTLSSMLIPFHIAFAETIYEQDFELFFGRISGNNSWNKFMGEEIRASSVLVDVPVSRLTLKLACQHVSDSDCSAFTGLITIGIWNSTIEPTDSNMLRSIATVDPTTLNENPNINNVVAHSWVFTAYTFTGEEVIGAYYDVDLDGNANNAILISGESPGTFDGTATRLTAWDNSLSDFSPSDALDMGALMSNTLNTQGGIDCTLPANENLLTCRLLAESTNPLAGASELIGDSAVNIAVQTGLISGTDLNPQTNGVGYIIVAIGLGIFIGILWVAGRGDLTSIPTFVWFIGTIAIVGAVTAFEYIDPTFLIISVIVVIAFAVAKAKGVFTGQGLFAGEAR